ncbi:MAG: hypothetical protein SOR88_03795 [Roseburia inulinivorans]|nr:hypothetical protein [Roseburia inulinivorans]
MKLLFKQRLFSWFDSYDIYDEAGNTVYVVKGQFSWGHKHAIYDAYVIDVQNPGNALDALMFVLAIDAEKCSRN